MLLDLRDQVPHLRDLAPLRLDDLLRELARARVADVRPLVMIAIEWCGIIAFMYATSPIVCWLRTRYSALAKTTTDTT